MIDRSLELVEKNAKLIEPRQDLAIVNFVTPGENPVYAGAAGAPAEMTPTVCIHTFPLPFQKWRHLFTDTFARHVDSLLQRLGAGEIDFRGGGEYALPTGAEEA